MLCKELELRKNEFQDELVNCIYFGGGTPSICSQEEIDKIIKTVYANYKVVDKPEITLEANPDDLTTEKLVHFSNSKINRLSIGVQSFFEKDLKLMNRAHNAEEAYNCILNAKKYFQNLSVDLIYGIPNLSNEEWEDNLEKVISLAIPHISCYALTVEPNTALEKQISNGIVEQPKDSNAEEHYNILINKLIKNGYVNYEFSNFGKKGFFSQNNTAYWSGEKYIGIGPSAHSFNGIQRKWNVANNNIYIKGIQNKKPVFEVETLSKTDRFNEYIMTGLRTMWGVSIAKIKQDFGMSYFNHLVKQSQKHMDTGVLSCNDECYFLTNKGKFLGDGIASDLFLLN